MNFVVVINLNNKTKISLINHTIGDGLQRLANIEKFSRFSGTKEIAE